MLQIAINEFGPALFAGYALFVEWGDRQVTLLQYAAQTPVSLIAVLAMLLIGAETLALTHLGRANISAYGLIVPCFVQARDSLVMVKWTKLR